MSGFFARLGAVFGLGASPADVQALAELRGKVRALLDAQQRDYEQRAAHPGFAETAHDVLVGVTYAEEAFREVDELKPAPRPARWLALFVRKLDAQLARMREHELDEHGYASATIQEVRNKAAELLA